MVSVSKYYVVLGLYRGVLTNRVKMNRVSKGSSFSIEYVVAFCWVVSGLSCSMFTRKRAHEFWCMGLMDHGSERGVERSGHWQ